MRLFSPDEDQPKDGPRLVEAVEAGDVESVRELLAAGAFVDSRDLAGHSVLVIAGVNGHREIFEMLLDAGADPNALVNNTPRARMRDGSPRIVFATAYAVLLRPARCMANAGAIWRWAKALPTPRALFTRWRACWASIPGSSSSG